MARSDFVTWLPLDRWAAIMGIDPFSFNQLSSDTIHPNNSCGDVWFSKSWQHSDRVGRDDVAMAIQQAEQEISREVGYNLVPDWTLAERLPYPRPGQPGVFNTWGTNPQGFFKSVETSKGHIISGGVRTKTLIEAGVAVVRTDADNDTIFAELCTVTVATSVADTNEIHVYFPGHSGNDAWEIRPITVSISGGVATITYKAWQSADNDLQESIPAAPLDALVAENFAQTVDVYRVWNDPSTQVQFMWENFASPCGNCGTCATCQMEAQAGCFHLRDQRIGIVVPAPGTWDATTSTFTTSEFSALREPDQIRIWYYSGYVDQHLPRPYVEMSPLFEYAVAYYAASKLDRPVCGCSNISEFIEHWRLDQMFSSLNSGGFNVTQEFAGNRLGTSVGAFYAYRRIHQPGVIVNK